MDRSERMEVLQLLEQGDITAAEAAARLGGGTTGPGDAPAPPPPPDVVDAPHAPEPMPAVSLTMDPMGDDVSPQEPMPSPAATAVTKTGPRWLRIRVTDTRTGRSRVNVNVPIALVEFGLKMGKAVTPEVAGVDLNELSAALKSGSNGKLVEVMDEEDGELVEILID